jgi:hypothetical protein
MAFTELQEQQLLFDWAEMSKGRCPEIGLLFHIGNERMCTPYYAKQMKRAGVKSGVPDICLPVPRGGYAALYIEMKRVKGGAVSANQKVWINELNKAGNRAVVCKGFEQARDAILDYLEIKTTNTAVNSCVACGADMPEGDQVCINCRKEWKL